VRLADEHHGDPACTSLRYASELVPSRRGTDVAVVGHAYGRGRPEIEAGFRVGALEKMIRVLGPRLWVAGGGGGGAVAGPVAFDRIPLRYELAFGGTAQQDGQPAPFPENPVGLGLGPELPDRSPLPSLEYAGAPWKGPRSKPAPAGLGFVPPGWRQRARFAGTFDGAWARDRRPLLPADLDERFYNAVPEDQVVRAGLQGGEPLLLRGVHPEAETVLLTLPRLAFEAIFQVRGRAETVLATCDGLCVEPDQGRLTLTWRASLPVGPDVARVSRVIVRKASPKGA
jgi:hypothetical protein